MTTKTALFLTFAEYCAELEAPFLLQALCYLVSFGVFMPLALTFCGGFIFLAVVMFLPIPKSDSKRNPWQEEIEGQERERQEFLRNAGLDYERKRLERQREEHWWK